MKTHQERLLHSPTTPHLRVIENTRPYLKITPRKGIASLHLNEVIAYRELLYFLVWRDVKVRYKQTALGALWAILQPLMTMLVFSFFFGRLARMPSEGVPYPLFSLAALIVWTFFAQGMNQAANSLVGNSNLIKKVYFPRLIIPLASITASLVDFACSCLLVVSMLLYYGIRPHMTLLLLPLFLTLAFITALGAGLWLCALNVRYRDIRYTIPFLTQFWLFATPVAYPSGLLNEPWRTFYGLNPMVGVVEGFRYALLGTQMPALSMLALSSIVAIALLISGTYYFKHLEKSFADSL